MNSDFEKTQSNYIWLQAHSKKYIYTSQENWIFYNVNTCWYQLYVFPLVTNSEVQMAVLYITAYKPQEMVSKKICSLQ